MDVRTTYRTLTLLITFCLAGLAQTGTANPAQTQTPGALPVKATGAGYVGSEVCKTCHPTVWATFFKNPHYKSIAAGNLAPDVTGCEGCHGPAKAHVEAGGGRNTIPSPFSLMTPKQVLDNCLTCHSKDLSRSNIRRSEHSLADVACSTCHSIHRSPVQKYLLAKEQRELCYGCHTQVRAQFSMPFKHRVNEGFMQCTDCHNPHGTPAPTWKMAARPRMVDQSLANEEPCLKCHTDKRGPFLFEHAAVRVDGCGSCHSPHGSTNPRLMTRPVVFGMCLECHNGTPGFGRTGEGVPIQAPSHNMALPKYQKCTTCHVRIHGSNADSRFLR